MWFFEPLVLAETIDARGDPFPQIFPRPPNVLERLLGRLPGGDSVESARELLDLDTVADLGFRVDSDPELVPVLGLARLGVGIVESEDRVPVERREQSRRFSPCPKPLPGFLIS